jgi:excisionase family DNA binding protein
MKKIQQQFDCIGGGEVYYTIAEVCGILKVSKPTLWRLSKVRGLKKVKDGGLVRYRKSVVDRWIADRESGDDSN